MRPIRMLPAADTAVSSRSYTGQKRPQRMLHPLCGAMWCGVEALRERWRAAGPWRWADGSNRTNRINESCRLARPCPPVKPYIYSTYKLTSVLLLYCAHVHRFWRKKQHTQQIVRSSSLSSSLLVGSSARRVGSDGPAADTAVSSRFYTGQKRPQRMLHPLCGAMWYGVGALRERRRATALGRHVESNESNQRIRSARTAVPTCQTVYLQHIQIYQCFTTLLCSCS